MEVKDYMELPYTRIVKEMNDESGHYFYGKILELDGARVQAIRWKNCTKILTKLWKDI